MINFALNINDTTDDDDVPPTLEEETGDDGAEGTRMEDID